MLVFPQDKTRNRSVNWSDDISLADAAAKGDTVAQKQLVSKVMTSIRKTLAYISSNPADVDDLTQLAIIQVLRSAKNYRGESALTYWADRIARRPEWIQPLGSSWGSDFVECRRRLPNLWIVAVVFSVVLFQPAYVL